LLHNLNLFDRATDSAIIGLYSGYCQPGWSILNDWDLNTSRQG